MHRVFRRQFNYSDLSQKQTSGDEDVINGTAEVCHLVIFLSVVPADKHDPSDKTPVVR